MKELSVEEQIYLCKYHDVDSSLYITIGLNENEVKETIYKLKQNGLYDQYRKLSEDEYENIIKKEKRKSKYEKILDRYKFDKTKKAYSSLKEVLSISDNYKNTEVFSLEKVFREIAERKNVKSYIINNDCKRILDNTYLENRAIFEENKYYKKPTLREFVLQELNLQDAKTKENASYDEERCKDESKENICESKEKSSEIKESVICDITLSQIGDIENTFVKVSVKTIMEWSYQKRIFR